MSKYFQLEEVCLALLERFGILYEAIPADEIAQEQDDTHLEDRMGGCEVYSTELGKHIYTVFPDDVQELLLLMASTIYSDDEDDLSFEFELDPRPVRDQEDEED